MTKNLTDDYLKINKEIEKVLKNIFKLAQPIRNNVLAAENSKEKVDFMFLKEVTAIEDKYETSKESSSKVR